MSAASDRAPERPPHTPPPPSSGPRGLRRYRVVLHRAANTGLLAVMGVLRELTRYGEEEARVRMWEAHLRGQADILDTHLERAELYVEQFADRGLFASIEPA